MLTKSRPERSVIMKSEKCVALRVMIKAGSAHHDETCTTPLLAEYCTKLHMQINTHNEIAFQFTFKY